MGESLWHDLDAWQVGIIDAAMGEDSEYDTLKLARVDTALVWDLQVWMEWPKPAVAVMSFMETREPGPHGDGIAHFTKRYPTIWLAVTEGTQANAKRDAKILVKRMETLARGLYQQAFTLPADDSGERVVNLALGRGELSARPVRSSNDDLWMVMAGIALEFETEV
ncbi:MAG: hypothetical protein IT328_20145 [Caldilineaceae bacterium]|nr:hypothetical protein [Caldilineaceae bacterium]